MGTNPVSTAGIEGLPYSIVDKVVIPSDIEAGDYLLSWRWDCEQSPQIWQNCADVQIDGGVLHVEPAGGDERHTRQMLHDAVIVRLLKPHRRMGKCSLRQIRTPRRARPASLSGP